MSETSQLDGKIVLEALKLCQETYKTTLRMTGLLALPRDSHSTIRLALQGTILELGNATFLCLSSGILSASEILLRSMLEAHVDLLAASRDKTYFAHRALKHHLDWRAILNAAKSKKNDFLADLSALPNLDDLIEDRNKRIATLETEGAKNLSVEERFRVADVLELYDGVFRRLSACSHNSFGELIRRHASNSSNNRLELTMFRNAERHEEYLIADTLTGLLLGSILQFEEFLSKDQLEEIETLKNARLEIGRGQ